MRGRDLGIVGWTKNSFIDYPGTVCTVLFFSGCNLRCPYCHNPQVVLNDGLEAVDHEEVLRFLRKRRGQIEGVVLSGGEPTLHRTIVDLVPLYRELGYRVKLDTNGLSPEVIERVAPDYLALDIKTSPRLYAERAGATCDDPVRRLTRAAAIARDMGERAEIRITVAPGFVDAGIIDEIGELIRGACRAVLQPMQQRVPLLDPAYNICTPVPAEEIEGFRRALSSFVGSCTTRGA